MQFNTSDIIHYYDSCESDYRLVWNLNRCGAMHFGFWDRDINSLPQALLRENEVLAGIAKIARDDVVLDAGCGVGGSAVFLAKRTGCKVVGITPSEKQVSHARKFSLKNGTADLTDFLVADFNKTNFEKDSFDVVWAIESVCHATSKEDFIRESARVLKKGGKLIMADGFATKDSFLEQENVLMRKWLDGWRVNSLCTEAQFTKWLKKHSFGNIKFLDATDKVMKSSRRLYHYSYPALFFGKMLELLKIRNKAQTENIVAAHYQHKALKNGLWKYGVLYAEKE